MFINAEEKQWCSRKVYIMVLICQSLGISTVNTIPTQALTHGAAGYTIFLTIFFIFLGIPLLYMEAVIGQFTSRDCIDVWKIRHCFSFMGYIVVGWQMIILIQNHITTSFLAHYFLISFENPIPFYNCGPWSSKYCNSLVTNYTVNQDCVRYDTLFAYCDNLYRTFPEYQYWRRQLVKASDKENFNIAWRVCLASGLCCFITYFACFKRYKSLKCFVNIFALYPMITVILILMGSMLQKGIVAKYEEALDLDFSNFKQRFRVANIINQVVYNLNIGSGVMVTLASTTSFRTPCFSDIVIGVVFTSVFAVMSVYTFAMMACPYAFEYAIKPVALIKTAMSFNFEKVPRLLFKYENKTFYLILVFSCNTLLGISSNVMFLFSLLEIFFKRCPKFKKYPGLTTLVFIFALFMVTIPLLSHHGINIIAYSYRKNLVLFSTFLAIIECLVFLIWYGMHRFAEDVHFMLGIKPGKCIKASWIVTVILLFYTFGSELYYQIKNSVSSIYATYALLGLVGILTSIFLLRLLVAIFTKRFVEFFALDPTWGPDNDLLQRSRAMFSAKAMTKEYIYRQYSLQAGINARQQKSNVRTNSRQT